MTNNTLHEKKESKVFEQGIFHCSNPFLDIACSSSSSCHVQYILCFSWTDMKCVSYGKTNVYFTNLSIILSVCIFLTCTESCVLWMGLTFVYLQLIRGGKAPMLSSNTTEMKQHTWLLNIKGVIYVIWLGVVVLVTISFPFFIWLSYSVNVIGKPKHTDVSVFFVPACHSFIAAVISIEYNNAQKCHDKKNYYSSRLSY